MTRKAHFPLKEYDTLYYYDGPVLLSFNTKADRKLVAICVDDVEHNYFCAEVSVELYDEYMGGNGVDLYGLLDKPTYKWYFMKMESDHFFGHEIKKITSEHRKNYFPSKGFWHYRK